MDKKNKNKYTIKRLEKCMDCCNDYRGIKSIDKDMIPILIELNEKGWKTNFCCSGHKEKIEKNGNWDAYITFSKKIKSIPNLIMFESRTKKEAKNGKYSRFEKGFNGFYWYGSSSNKMSVEEKELERKQFINDLFNCVKELPEYEYRNN